MTDAMHARLIILGSGPAGYTAAVYAARANLAPVLITGMEPGGQLMTTTEVDNWPGGAEGLQGPQLMEQLREHVERLQVEMPFDHIESVDLASKPMRLTGAERRLHGRRADHRHRRLGPLPWPAERDPPARQGRFGLRHLRRILL